MFRVLDLISEPGSGWLVDKVIISQESLKGFINALSPGVYHSLTRVDFKTLDTLRIQPLGLYGSKSEIIKFLVSQSFIDEATARKLQGSTGDPLSPRLRSGLYLLRTFSGDAGSELVFVIYWPEDTTWNDDAISPVRRNRVTFMRYLMKICDQVACLLSSEHAESIVWDDGSEDALMNVNDVSNRLFKFQVAKTHEQDEAVAVRPGFQIVDPLLSRRETPPGAEAFDLKPRLIAGETHQGFLIFKYIPRGMQERHFREMYNLTKLRSLLETGAIWLNPDLNDDIITTFMVHGLQVRYRKAFGDWKARKTTFNKAEDDVCVKQIADLEKRKERDSHELESILRQSLCPPRSVF
ncbi:hypothetical protein B0H10DRAFT_1063400 [Mycena sp. CBHHK59/15]|nr:hypothetical protein B0H10DRAFT_1063400 [Mycena sp. CBHHK59/15]